ncbi:apolipoprotein N-acyltransferase [Aliikangiella sp. G2MR2-5]|uniref:apolipoprotein N-acyltransferase n=1 Tax=Aliikangiella sp. G2MR2-5 TaxID=2788943 RepID=UPI0018A94376|nr:apolipoprotein N-acyltransferase [Aliikangiella sp. G2MR2-5]
MIFQDFQSIVQRFVQYCTANHWRLRTSLLISGAVYPLAFEPFGWWLLAFLSIIFLCLVILSDKVLSNFKVGLYWGLGAFGVGASWVYVSIHEFGFVPMIGAAALTLLFVVILSLYKAIFAWVAGWFIVRTGKMLAVISLPLAWLLSEWIQASFLNGFPWLLTGYSQIDSPLGAVASWVGVFGVSWFTLCFSCLIALMLLSKQIKVYLAVSGILVLVVISINWQYFSLKPHKKRNAPVDVALIQPNVLQHEKWDRRYFGKIVQTMYQQTEDVWEAELIVWPEGAIPAYAHQVQDITRDLEIKAKNNSSHLIMGIPEYQKSNGRSYVALKSFGESLQSYHKQVLVPFGEYVPMEDWLRGAIKFLNLPMSGFSEASNEQPPMRVSDYVLVPAICYEIAYPGIVRGLAIQAGEQPAMIVTVSNEAWFGDSFGPYQHMQMARMRAKELGIPLIRSTNDGITAVVDSRGKLLKKLPRYQAGSLRAKVELTNLPTIYQRYGFWGLYATLIVCLLILVVAFFSKMETKSTKSE